MSILQNCEKTNAYCLRLTLSVVFCNGGSSRGVHHFYTAAEPQNCGMSSHVPPMIVTSPKGAVTSPPPGAEGSPSPTLAPPPPVHDLPQQDGHPQQPAFSENLKGGERGQKLWNSSHFTSVSSEHPLGLLNSGPPSTAHIQSSK